MIGIRLVNHAPFKKISTTCVLEKSSFLKFCNIHSKASVLESLLNNFCNFLKKDSTQMFSCEYCEIFINTYFEEHLQMGLLADSETSCPMRLLLAAILKS